MACDDHLILRESLESDREIKGPLNCDDPADIRRYALGPQVKVNFFSQFLKFLTAREISFPNVFKIPLPTTIYLIPNLTGRYPSETAAASQLSFPFTSEKEFSVFQLLLKSGFFTV